MVKRVDSGAISSTGTGSLTISCYIAPFSRIDVVAAASLGSYRDEIKFISTTYLAQSLPMVSVSGLVQALETQQRKLPSFLAKECGKALSGGRLFKEGSAEIG